MSLIDESTPAWQTGSGGWYSEIYQQPNLIISDDSQATDEARRTGPSTLGHILSAEDHIRIVNEGNRAATNLRISLHSSIPKLMNASVNSLEEVVVERQEDTELLVRAPRLQTQTDLTMTIPVSDTVDLPHRKYDYSIIHDKGYMKGTLSYESIKREFNITSSNPIKLEDLESVPFEHVFAADREQMVDVYQAAPPASMIQHERILFEIDSPNPDVTVEVTEKGINFFEPVSLAIRISLALAVGFGILFILGRYWQAGKRRRSEQ